jgi:hypothetical protein
VPKGQSSGERNGCMSSEGDWSSDSNESTDDKKPRAGRHLPHDQTKRRHGNSEGL